ncbi:hypothetical protein IFM89_009527 [Coptis chinensis]|uniref:Annexin n=1 Tax=Coptis chinensis TaxID=261450 RepID=A0A835HTY8_9MAGN|nr:hypothetical protein IFM89_009527 [Coptis chinensis]
MASHTSGDIRKILVALASRHIQVVRNTLTKVGTDEDALKEDLKVIKEMYFKRNIVTLAKSIAKETSGDYKAFLLTLLGE